MPARVAEDPHSSTSSNRSEAIEPGCPQAERAERNVLRANDQGGRQLALRIAATPQGVAMRSNLSAR